jgi:hypothetical protein
VQPPRRHDACDLGDDFVFLLAGRRGLHRRGVHLARDVHGEFDVFDFLGCLVEPLRGLPAWCSEAGALLLDRCGGTPSTAASLTVWSPR